MKFGTALVFSTCFLIAGPFGSAQTAAAPQTFSQVVQQVMAEPVFRHANLGVELYSLDRKQVLFSLNGQKLFTPGSTTKLLTEGTALQILGPDYRFHTLVYRTGPIDKRGTLKGDLVLVASGDPNLSNREQPDGSLAFSDEDHSYGGPDSKLVPGDPLVVLRQLAQQIAAAGIQRVQGRVWVDVSLFPEGDRELGTGVVVSPIVVNDNVIDATITPGATAGAPANVQFSIQVPYIHFENKLTTGAPGSWTSVKDAEVTDNPDGSQTVTMAGSVPLGSGSYISSYPVPSPSHFAEVLLTQALEDKGIKVDGKAAGGSFDLAKAKPFYAPQYKVAEHVSAPLSEEIKVTLKVSQNLHASMTPFLVGAIAGKATEKIDQKGFALEHDFLTKAGLDLSGASQSDGAGGANAAFFTPDFMVHYLAYMAEQPTFPVFHKALPILGRDGTLARIEINSPAAGNVFAKTGTFGAFDLLNMQLMLVGKGLAGYMTTASGEHLSFALYLNHVALPHEPDAADSVGGAALGKIAAAAYSLPIDQTTLEEK